MTLMETNNTIKSYNAGTSSAVKLAYVDTSVNNISYTPNIVNTTNSIYMPTSISLDAIISYLNEDEIIKLFDTLFERIPNSAEFKDIVVSAVRSTHFSEEFLLKYSFYLTEYDVKIRHCRELNSGEYSQLALYFLSKEK